MTIQLPSSPAQTGLFPGEKEVGDHVSEGGPRETEQLYTERNVTGLCSGLLSE